LQSAVIALCYHHYRRVAAGTVLGGVIASFPTFRLLDLLALWLALVGAACVGTAKP